MIISTKSLEALDFPEEFDCTRILHEVDLSVTQIYWRHVLWWEQHSVRKFLFVCTINLCVAMLFLPNVITYTLVYPIKTLIILWYVEK